MTALPFFDPDTVVATLPTLPGVYRMMGAHDEALYVGKARNLKARVSSYFRESGLSPRIRLMVSRVVRIDTTVTRTENEALVLENELIKSLAPRYNILFRDDKSYPYLLLSADRFPRISSFRGTPGKHDRVFGPFPNAWAVRESVQILQRVFRLRTCEDSVFAHRTRPCLLHQIKRCTAPCVGLIDEKRYFQDVRDAVAFLDGHENELVDRLTERMNEAAGALRFEEAALHRDRIRHLSRVREKQFVSSTPDQNVDIVAVAISQGTVCVNLTMIRGGRNLGDRNFFPDHAANTDPPTVLDAFLSQHYVERPMPPVIVVSHTVDDETMDAIFTAHAAKPTHVVSNPSGERRGFLANGVKNAELAATRHATARDTQGIRLHTLRDALGLPGVSRIECFDISHTMGEATVASCVVFDHEAMQPSEYRRFNIASTDSGDDYAAMREALSRRFRRVASGEIPVPELLFVDGGKGQVRVAADVLTELGLGEISTIGIAKGEARKPGLEILKFPDARPDMHLSPESPALHLIQQIRDEAHRFAITGHRHRRAKLHTTSVLEEIPGVGARKRQQLIAAFGGLQGVARAGVDELVRVKGIGRALAERIYQELH